MEDFSCVFYLYVELFNSVLHIEGLFVYEVIEEGFPLVGKKTDDYDNKPKRTKT